MIGASMLEETKLRIGYIIIFVAAIGFICSLTYNCGYFWLFDAGIRILSIGDILTSYTLWIPGFATLIFGVCLDVVLERIESKDRFIKSKKYHNLINRFLLTTHVLILTAMSIILIACILFGFKYRPIIVWFSFCYVLFSIYGHISHKIKLQRINKYILGLISFVLVILSLMFVLGIDKALMDSRLNRPNANVYFINKHAPQPVILLRHLEKGLLAKEINQQNYILFTWDDLTKIELIAGKKHFSGVFENYSKIKGS